MQISIKTLTGKTLSLFPPPKSSISDLKSLLKLEANFPISEQTLILSNKPLLNISLLSEYQEELKKSNNTLYLSLKLKGGFQIFVKNLNGNTLTIDCNKDETIGILKKMIDDKIDGNIDDYFVYYGGKPLDNDELKLTDYDIKKESTLNLVYRLRGGN